VPILSFWRANPIPFVVVKVAETIAEVKPSSWHINFHLHQRSSKTRSQNLRQPETRVFALIFTRRF
jgi:hypothetical protein